MSGEQGRVFLVDDDLSVRRALKSLLTSHGFEVHLFPSAGDFLHAAVEPGPARCLLLDVQLPDLNGLDLQRDLGDGEHSMPIVFISGHGDIPMSVRAIKGGAVDFLSKPVDEGMLIDAVSAALRRDQEERSSREELREIGRRLGTLTPREHEVLRHVIAGLLNKQIAGELGIKEKTVKVHRAQVMRKMGADSVAALTRMTEKARIEPAC